MIILLGVALKRFGFWVNNEKNVLTRLLYWIVLPALLFRTTYTYGTGIGRFGGLAVSTYASLIIAPLVAFIMARTITHRNDRKYQALTTMMSARSNNLYLGLPAAVLAMGQTGAELGSIYLAIAMPGYNLITILWGQVVLSGSLSIRSISEFGKKIISNPLIASSILGIACAQIGLAIPDTILTSLKLLADMSTGVALLALGASLELEDTFGAIKRTWPDIVFKLIIHPVLAVIFMLMCSVESDMLKVTALITAMPTAVNCFIIAGGMGMDEKYACETVALSTLFSAITIPAWVFVLGIG